MPEYARAFRVRFAPFRNVADANGSDVVDVWALDIPSSPEAGWGIGGAMGPLGVGESGCRPAGLT